MRRLLAGLMLLTAFCAPVVHAASAPSPDEMADALFGKMIKGDSGQAVDEFFSANPLVLQKAQQMQLLKGQLGTVMQLYGQPFAYEKISTEDITPSLQRRLYLTKHEYHPVIWEMYFYKPKDRWLPDQLLFVDQYQVLGPKK